MARVTHLAKELGISPATVSRALSRPDMVSKKTLERVMQKAKELGIDIGKDKSLLEEQPLLGVLVADLNNPFSAAILNAISTRATLEGYKVVMGVTLESYVNERKIIADFNALKLKGLIAMPTGGGSLSIECSNIVAIDRPFTHKQSRCALIDNARAVKLAYDHLVSQGHSKVAYISGKSSLYTFQTRLAAAQQYSDVIDCYELDALEYNDLYTKSFELTNILLSRNDNRPTAILTANNAITAGVTYALTLHQVSMPDDMALVSIGEPEWSRFFPVPITCIKLPEVELANCAFDLLKIHENTVRLIKPILIPRASS